MTTKQTKRVAHVLRNRKIYTEVTGNIIWWTSEQRGQYTVLNNYILGAIDPDPVNQPTTLTTQSTYETIDHVVKHCRLFRGPLSVAVYAPGDDFPLAINLIYFLREQCSPINRCIYLHVTWHIVYDSEHPPYYDAVGVSGSSITFPENYVGSFDCKHDINVNVKIQSIYGDQMTTSIQMSSNDITTTTKTTTSSNTIIWWTRQTRGLYTVLNNYIPADLDHYDQLDTSVTMTTQGTYSFIHHIEHQCQRWEGPISMAVYAPGDEFALAINLIYYMKQCSNPCVRTRTTWHLVYDTLYSPARPAGGAVNTSFPDSYLIAFNCSESYQQIIDKFNISQNSSQTFRSVHKLTYPINVCRNVARLNAKTRYVSAIDSELYPSGGLVSGFVKLMERERNISRNYPVVYVMPIFEVDESVAEAPTNKSELSKLMAKGKAVFFHHYTCDSCQSFPNRKQWLNYKPKTNDSLGIFLITQRTRMMTYWEPLYIGTNNEPWYDERINWDGKLDKMTHMIEMCLLGYRLAILDNAFLVHAPGIKRSGRQNDQVFIVVFPNAKLYNTVSSQILPNN
ncbi:beta-1,4-glucuronyltransferase 1-like [Oppia nitens]|uniref:beta-1,4-glucuronyltransferase 1-like n=1 Tax=Oppia nitens TaxID=1686743 RepID=UPI0023D9813E|nr:beta-1,4-glucuronyltransferase 1-like [Oppia nitens]